MLTYLRGQPYNKIMAKRRKKRTHFSPHVLVSVVVVALVIGIGLGYATAQVPGVSHDWGEITGVAVTSGQLATGSVDSDALLDNSVKTLDVDNSQICVTEFVPSTQASAGCPDLTEFECDLVHPAALGSFAVKIPDTCYESSCLLSAIATDGAAKRYAAGVLTQFGPEPPPDNPTPWVMLEYIDGATAPTDITLESGINGDAGETAIFDFGPGGPNIVLYDDHSAGPEASSDDWYVLDSDASWGVDIWVC